jgi:hypothetical protein
VESPNAVFAPKEDGAASASVQTKIAETAVPFIVWPVPDMGCKHPS